MKSRIKFDDIVTTSKYGEFSFKNFTRNLNLIPDEYFKDDYYNKILVDDDLTFELCSLGIYGVTDYWDILMIYNKINDPLVLPKSTYVVSDLVDVKFNKWLERYLRKGKDIDVPDIMIKDNIWYMFVADEYSTRIENKELITKQSEYNKQIDEKTLKLTLLESEYESIKDDGSEYGVFRRKNLRQEIYDIREEIFKIQEIILDLVEDGIEPKGTWVPIKQKDAEKLINKNTSTMVKNVYDKMMNDELIKNEQYRYIKYPKREYLAKILDFINKGL
jgi:hypothetical protein